VPNQIRLVPIDSVKVHPKAEIIPDMKKSEWDEFYLDIANHDIKVPLEVTADGTIVDGRHRYKAALQLGKKEIPIIDAPLNGDSPEDYMIKAALLRRHLTDDQWGTIAALWNRENKEQGKRSDLTSAQRCAEVTGKASPNYGKSAQRSAVMDSSPTRQAAVQQFKTPRRKVDDCTKLLNNNPELFDKVHEGDLSLRDAKTVANLETEDQKRVLDMVGTGEAKNVRVARRQVQRDNAVKIKPPTGKYQVIYADPPWDYEFGFDIHGAASRHYNTMTIEELCNLPIKDLTADNAALFLWVTSPKLEECFQVIHAWGFEYKTSFVWDKVKHVMGHYNSLRHEFLLLAIKGSYHKQSKNLKDSVQSIERNGNHSEKPEEFRQIIDEMYPQATKIELFQTKRSISGWSTWGDRT